MTANRVPAAGAGATRGALPDRLHAALRAALFALLALAAVLETFVAL